MRSRNPAWLAAVLIALCGPAPAADEQADTILINGGIHTLNQEQPGAEALAIRSGVIIAVGGNDDIAALAGPQTRHINLQGKVVLPGFHDVHVHPLFAGIRQTECNIPQGSTLDQTREQVKTCVGKAENGEWITGGQWDAFEAARRTNGFIGLLHEVGHCTFVSRQDLPRARPLGATFEVSPYLWSPSPINDDITREVGEKHIARVWPVREMLEADALVVAGSDWAVVPSVNPWIAVEALVTREKPGGSEKHFGKQQAISLDQAIRLFTVNAAKHLGMADRIGRIEPGLLADLIVLDRDPYSIPVTELHQVKVEKTMINGAVVFEAPE